MNLSKLSHILLPVSFVALIVACSLHKPVPKVEEPIQEAALPAIDSDYYTVVETPAMFNGGDIKNFIPYIKKNIKYPATALKKKQQGTVVVQFGIDWNGKVNVFSVLKSSGVKTLDDEAVRVLNTSPAWIPAKNKTQSVGQLYILQFKFNAKTKKVDIS